MQFLKIRTSNALFRWINTGIFAVFYSIILGSHAMAQNTEDAPYASFNLDNGLQVVVLPDHRAPVVTHMIWYKAGSADEPKGKSGIAHYLEHVMFKGTKTVPAGEFSKKVAEIGGLENAFTSSDYTGYYQKISPDALRMVMGYEADRMENLVLTDEIIITERDVILEERRSRIDNQPGGKMGEVMDASFYLHHPYGIPIIGYENEITALTAKDAIAFYDKFYTPNNAVLVVAGDVDEETVRKFAEQTYGKVKRRAEPGKRVRPVEPAPIAARSVTYEDARITNPSWRRIYLVPSYQNAEAGEAEAIDLLGTILGGSSTSRLHRKLVIDDKLATSAQAGYRGGSYNQTRLSVYGSPRGETTVSELENAMDVVIDKLVADGITETELNRARNSLLQTVIYRRDSQTAMARIVGAVLAMDGKLDDVFKWSDRLRKITVADVNRVAKKYLLKERSVTGYLLPKKTAPENADTKSKKKDT